MRDLTSQLRDHLRLLTGTGDSSPRQRAGQSLIEFVLVIAVICVVAIPAIQVLREGFVAAYLVHDQALQVTTHATPTVLH